MIFFDSHCHLQDERIKDHASEVIQQALSDGVAYMLCCGSCESDWEDVALLARRWKQIIPAFGIHPWYISTCSARWRDCLCDYLREFPHAAVGEIGLDHLHTTDNWREQLEVFTEQLELATQMKRPVSVHCLKAWGDLLKTFSSMKKLPEHIALHSYSGSAELVQVLATMGCYFSCSGTVTHNKNTRIRNAVTTFPRERILLETDTPDIPPQGYQGYTNPSLINQVNEAVAALCNFDAEQMAHISYKNACTCFGVDNI